MGVTAQAEPVYLRTKDGIHRVVIRPPWRRAAGGRHALRVEAAGQATEVSARSVLLFDSIPATLEVPDMPGAMEVKITGSAAGRTVTKTVRVAAARKWRLYVAARRTPTSATPIYSRNALSGTTRTPTRRSTFCIAIRTFVGTSKSPGRRKTTSTRGAASGWPIFIATPGKESSASRPSIATCSRACARPRRLAG